MTSISVLPGGSCTHLPVWELEIDGEVVDQFPRDGLIISRRPLPGYSMRGWTDPATPGIRCNLWYPICPDELSSRPLVVPPRFSTLVVLPRVSASRRVKLWKDGAHATVLETWPRCFGATLVSHSALMWCSSRARPIYDLDPQAPLGRWNLTSGEPSNKLIGDRPRERACLPPAARMDAMR